MIGKHLLVSERQNSKLKTATDQAAEEEADDLSGFQGRSSIAAQGAGEGFRPKGFHYRIGTFQKGRGIRPKGFLYRIDVKQSKLKV